MEIRHVSDLHCSIKTDIYFAHLLKSGRFEAQKFEPPRSAVPLNFAVITFDFVIVRREFGQAAAAACSHALSETADVSSLSHSLVPLHFE